MRAQTVERKSLERATVAIAGALYVVAGVIGLAIAVTFPAASASVQEWARFESSHQATVMVQEYLIHGVAAVALIVLASAARAILRGPDESSLLLDIAYGGAIAAASVSFVQASFGQVLANSVSSSGDLGAMQTLLALDNQADTFKLLGLALFVAALSIAAVQRRRLPAWMARAGAAVSLLLVAGGLSFPIAIPALSVALAASLLCLLAWVVVLTVALVRSAQALGPFRLSS